MLNFIAKKKKIGKYKSTNYQIKQEFIDNTSISSCFFELDKVHCNLFTNILYFFLFYDITIYGKNMESNISKNQ